MISVMEADVTEPLVPVRGESARSTPSILEADTERINSP